MIDEANNSNENITIQEAIGRDKSLRIIINDLVWLHTGLGAFTVDGVPYSSMTGRVFAKKFVESYY